MWWQFAFVFVARGAGQIAFFPATEPRGRAVALGVWVLALLVDFSDQSGVADHPNQNVGVGDESGPLYGSPRGDVGRMATGAGDRPEFVIAAL